MPKVKLIWTEQYTVDDYDSKEICRCIPEDLFEEISESELSLLQRNLHRIPRPNYNMTPRVVQLDEVTIAVRLADVQKLIQADDERIAAASRKREQAALKKKQTKTQQRKAQYEALRKEFEATISVGEK